jgi:acid phosphatase (class A)
LSAAIDQDSDAPHRARVECLILRRRADLTDSKRVPRAALALLFSLAVCLGSQALAQSGYLAGQEVDFHAFLGPPPAADSLWDHAEQGLVESLQAVDDSRWQMAELDQKELYSRFTESFGKPIDKKGAPVLVALLDRAIVDLEATATAAKDYFHRPRPFQRLQLQRVCEKRTPPKPEANPMQGSSYPSGHSVRGWAVAMILARVAPDRTDAVMKRAEEYQESRLVCGMHFPSDVEAGHDVATAVVARLDSSPEFQADLARARKEYAGH